MGGGGGGAEGGGGGWGGGGGDGWEGGGVGRRGGGGRAEDGCVEWGGGPLECGGVNPKIGFRTRFWYQFYAIGTNVGLWAETFRVHTHFSRRSQ